MKKSVIDNLVIAGGTGYRRWCGRLEGSPSCRQQIAYQRRDDIYPEAGTGRLALGEQLYADKIINRPRVFNGCCVSNRIFLTLKPGLTALHRR